LNITECNSLPEDTKFNFFKLSNYYLMEKIINNIERKEVFDIYLKYKEESIPNVDFKNYFENFNNSSNSKTIEFFENENDGFFILLKQIMNGQISNEEIFFEVLFH